MSKLQGLGWNEYFEARLAEQGGGFTEDSIGRVVAEHRGGYELLGPGGEMRAIAPRRLMEDTQTRPAVGDWVLFGPLAGDSSRVGIEQVLPRRSKLVRQAAGRRAAEQIVAANMDTVFMLTSINRELRLRRIERYLTVAWESGAQPVVVLTKADLVPDPEPTRERVQAVSPGVAVVVTTACREGGFSEVEPWLRPGSTIALVGSSGVGKSTLVNCLMGAEVQTVREIRSDDDEGRHTTTSRRLMVLPGQQGLLLDTPGIRELQLPGGDHTGIDEAFQDIKEFQAHCRFRDCSHNGEPGCAVGAAIEAGTLHPARLAGWEKLKREVEYQNARRLKTAAQVERGRWKKIMVQARKQRR